MIKRVPGEKRKRSNFSAFQSLVNSLYSRTALLLKLTLSLRKKNRVQKFFAGKLFFSGLIGKFHINFTVDNVFENLISTKRLNDRFNGSFCSQQA